MSQYAPRMLQLRNNELLIANINNFPSMTSRAFYKLKNIDSVKGRYR